LFSLGIGAALLFAAVGNTAAQEGPLGHLPGPRANGSAASILEGEWSSGCFPFSLGEGQENGATLDFQFVGNRWQVIFSTYAEPACAAPLFSLRREGPFAFGEPSTVIADATNMIFVGTQLGATAYTDDMAAFLAGAGCGTAPFVAGEEQEISATGCLSFRPVAERAIEYDIIHFDADGRLHFGLRPADDDLSIPERRPAEISPIALTAVEAGS
jgi:hypothetical protein